VCEMTLKVTGEDRSHTRSLLFHCNYVLYLVPLPIHEHVSRFRINKLKQPGIISAVCYFKYDQT